MRGRGWGRMLLDQYGAADIVDTMIRALNDPAFFKP